MEFYQSGCITHRARKIGIVWNGQNAEHVMSEYLNMPSVHPYTHIKIQQLAKHVKIWEPQGGRRFQGRVTDNATGVTVTIFADIYPKFALLITAVKQTIPLP